MTNASSTAALDVRLAYSPAQAARLLDMSRSRVYELMYDGTLPSLKIGRLRRIRHGALVAFLNECERGAA